MAMVGGVMLDNLVRAAGYISSSPVVHPGEAFTIRVAAPAQP